MYMFKKKFAVGLIFHQKYPPELQNLTADGYHQGVDFLTPQGETLLAGVDGILNERGWLGGFGNCIIIKFTTGPLFNRTTYRLICAHLSKITTMKKIGDRVRKTDVMGLTGTTGASTGPHCHVQVDQLKNGVWIPIDPKLVIGVC